MALEGRKGTKNRYLYRKERRGKRVVSVYLGRAPEPVEVEVCATPEPVCATAQAVEPAPVENPAPGRDWSRFFPLAGK